MAPVQCRNGKQVHDGQDNGQQCSHLPECLPVPAGREETADLDKSAKGFIGLGLGCKDQSQLFQVADGIAQPFAYPGRDGLQKGIFDLHQVEEPAQVTYRPDPDLTIGCSHKGIGDPFIIPQYGDRYLLSLQFFHPRPEFIKKPDFFPVEADDLVIHLQAGLLGRRFLAEVFHDERDPCSDEDLAFQQGGKMFLQYGDVKHLPVPFHLYGFCVIHHDVMEDLVEILDLHIVDRKDLITVAEPDIMGDRITHDPVFRILRRQVLFAPDIQRGGIDDQGQQEIDQHAAHHDQKALVGRFSTEFPWLGRFLHLLLVHGFIDHPGNLHIPSQWEPADTILRLANFLFEQGKPGIEKYVKLFHPRPEQLGKGKMPQLVKENKDG